MRDRKVPKCNAALVDAVFELMFETLWVAPYDRRRRHTTYAEYEACVRHTARMLSAVDLAAASEEQRRLMSQTVQTLAQSIRRLSEEGVFPADRCMTAIGIVERIGRQVADGSVAE